MYIFILYCIFKGIIFFANCIQNPPKNCTVHGDVFFVGKGWGPCKCVRTQISSRQHCTFVWGGAKKFAEGNWKLSWMD